MRRLHTARKNPPLALRLGLRRGSERRVLVPSARGLSKHTFGFKKKSNLRDDRLYLCDRNIGWLEDFEPFVNLKHVWVSRNAIRRLTGLETNFRLHSLYASQNQLTTLLDSSVPRLTFLEELVVNDNKSARAGSLDEEENR